MDNDIDEIKKMGEYLMGGGKSKQKSDSPEFFEAPKLDMAKNEFFSIPEFGAVEKPTKSSKPLMGGLASEEDTEKLAAMGRKMLGL